MNKTIKTNQFKDIVDYFNDIYGVDVSEKELIIVGQKENTLGSCDLNTGDIKISTEISGSLLECVIVHELSHYLQQKNISMCIDITSDKRYYNYGDGFMYTMFDLMWDELDVVEYWDRKTEIDARINEVCYAYYITEDINMVNLMKETVFRGGLTDNLYSCISNITIDCVRDFLLSEYMLRKQIKEEENIMANNEFLKELEDFDFGL